MKKECKNPSHSHYRRAAPAVAPFVDETAVGTFFWGSQLLLVSTLGYVWTIFGLSPYSLILSLPLLSGEA